MTLGTGGRRRYALITGKNWGGAALNMLSPLDVCYTCTEGDAVVDRRQVMQGWA